ncbi:hypothetical protein [Neomicrococcus lactis]|uniref:hypothetical protein n=1 Tax=Neomicrococcus lactis TaxID=732241 RepID=UPI0023013F05|nr:hypothetical protein [Neomicrococcus lactis]
MKLASSHVRMALALVALCGLGMFATFLAKGADALGIPTSVWPTLLVALLVGTVVLPVLTLVTKFANPAKITPAIIFALGLFASAIFIDDRFDVFPARILCIINSVLCMAGAVVVLFNALDSKSPREEKAARRFD